MRVYDISVGIQSGMPVWPGDPPVELTRISAIANGDNANVSRLSCGVHVGTHLDAPLHFVEGGASVESLSLKVLIGRAYVVSLPKVNVIDAACLDAADIPPRTKRVLFKTRNSALWARGETRFQTDFVAVDEGGAQWLVRKGVQLVGVEGYLPTSRAVRGGGYSAIAESNTVGPEGGQVLVDRTVDLVKSLWPEPKR